MKLEEIANESYFFETKVEYFEDKLFDKVLKEHYQFLRKNGKQIGSTNDFQSSVIQARFPDGTYIVGVHHKAILAAFCKYNIIDLNNKKYINIILVHSITRLANKFPELKRLIGKNFIIMLLDFMKGHFNLPFIEYTGYHSIDAMRAIKILSKNHNTYWLNIKTGETSEYDPTKDNPKQGEFNEPFRSTEGKTDWRIVVESKGTHDIEDYEIHDIYMSMLRRGLYND